MDRAGSIGRKTKTGWRRWRSRNAMTVRTGRNVIIDRSVAPLPTDASPMDIVEDVDKRYKKE
jgi:hypothetical protein